MSIFLSGQLPAISKKCPDVLYGSMDNVIPVDLNGVDPELVTFKATKSQRVTKYADSLYAVYPSSTEPESTLKLYYKNIIVEQKLLKILPSLQLTLKIENERDGEITKNELMKTAGFGIVPSNGPDPGIMNFRLISGNLIVYNQVGQILFSGNLRETAFTDQIKDIFQKLVPGSRIMITNPRVVNHFNQSMQVDPVKEWVVKE